MTYSGGVDEEEETMSGIPLDGLFLLSSATNCSLWRFYIVIMIFIKEKRHKVNPIVTKQNPRHSTPSIALSTTRKHGASRLIQLWRVMRG